MFAASNRLAMTCEYVVYGNPRLPVSSCAVKATTTSPSLAMAAEASDSFALLPATRNESPFV